MSQTVVYLFPGQGSDERIFEKIILDSNFRRVLVQYPEVAKGETMTSFAKRILPQINTGQPFVLNGVSMGGMICSELLNWVHPEKTILISSAETAEQLPKRYKFQRKLPLNKIVPKRCIKMGARMLQPLVEPDSKTRKETFQQMLKDKSPRYYKRTVNMIIHWDGEMAKAETIQIHGSEDHTIPIKNLTPEYVVEGGSHMMTLTQGELINQMILEILKSK